MANTESIIRGLLNKGKSVRNIEEPWWSKRYGDILGGISEIPAAIEGHKKRKAVQASRDLQTISGFEARIGNKINNYMASGDIYDESKITALKDSINSLYDKHSSQFPELISEFSDERDSALGRINNYSTKNKEKDTLLSKIEPTKQKLYSIVETLNTTATEDFTPDQKVKFRQEVYDTMEEITKLDKIIDDPYFSNLSGWADVAEDVKYGLSDASKQLITQINTWDSKNNVISPQDLENLENAIFKNDTAGIRAINKQIGEDKTARMTSYETDYAKSLKEYETINSFFASDAFQRTLDERNKAYNEADEEGKKKMDLDPEYWRVYNIDVPGLPDEGVDVTQDVHVPLLRAKARATKIDADYRNEHIAGSSIAEILNKPLPWDRGKKSLEQKQKEHEERMKGLGLTDPSVVGGDPVVTEGGEPFAVSELHKPVTPEVPTMPAGEPRKFSEWNNPGNLKFANQTDATGKTPTGFATFDTPDSGWKALYNQIEADKGRNDTLKQFIYGKGDDDYGYTATDREVYLKNLSKELNLSPNAKIDTVSTKKFANAIAKQEGWKGDFPKVEDKPKVTEEPLYKIDDGKPVVPPTSKPFVKAQSNLASVVSDKFSKLSASEKGKYKGNKEEATRKFVKDKFEQWLKESGNLRKANWKTKGKYAAEDFKYFIPTKVKGTTKRLWYPGAFKRQSLLAEPTGLSPLEYAKQRIDVFSPDITAPDMSDDVYVEFVKDFDAFRKFLQES